MTGSISFADVHDFSLIDDNSNSIEANYNLEEVNEEIDTVIDINSDFLDLTSSDGQIVEYIERKYTVGIEIKSELGTKWIPEVSEAVKPSIGSEFASIEDAFKFYGEYAIAGGFEARRSTQKVVKDDFGLEYVKIKWFVCSREGFKGKTKSDVVVEKDDANTLDNSEKVKGKKVEKEKQKRKTSTQRTGCLAGIRIGFNPEGKYVVYHFEESHNHFLVHPDFCKHLKTCRSLDYSKQVFLHNLNDASIGPSVGYRILSKIHGGYEGVGASKNDCKNWKRKYNMYMGDADSQMMVNMLKQKKEFLEDFSFEYFTVNGGELAGLFWADEASKLNYLAFGDVVSFDATYRTNKYDMVFIPFTGIDNHKKCVTFGAGMLAKEDIPSYTWLLKAFKKAFPIEPQIVLTDQDPSMKVAVVEIFKAARHRLCMWHIMEKLSLKVLQSILKAGLREQLTKIVWTDKINKEDFNKRWHQILRHFQVDNNKWLSDMYELRHNWIPAYFQDWEMSGLMRTSSRSESENHMFQQLMSSSSTLIEFYTHFDTAMQNQRWIQSENNQKSLYTTPDIITENGLEIHASKLFTRAVFLDIQEDMVASSKHCLCFNVSESSDGYSIYSIVDTSVKLSTIDESIDRKRFPNYFDELVHRQSKVFLNLVDKEVSCSCKKFERCGVFCKHVYYVLRLSGVQEFPSKYITKRWTICVVPAKNSTSRIEKLNFLDSQRNELKPILLDIYRTVDQCVNRYLAVPEKIALFRDSLVEMKNKADWEMGSQPPMGPKEFMAAMIGIPQPSSIDITNPKNIRNKGCGRNKRLMSVREEAITKEKRWRNCAYCKSLQQHDIRTCDQRIIDERLEKERLEKEKVQNSNGASTSGSK